MKRGNKYGGDAYSVEGDEVSEVNMLTEYFGICAKEAGIKLSEKDVENLLDSLKKPRDISMHSRSGYLCAPLEWKLNMKLGPFIK